MEPQKNKNMIKINKYLIINLFLGILVVSCEANVDDNKNIKSSNNLVSVQIKESNPAMSNPDKFAWDLFIKLNQPSSNNSNIVVWETWALASDVYSNPNVAPKWETSNKKNIDDFETAPLQQLAHLSLDQKILFDPNSPLRNETRMNKTVFDFIVNNELYNAEGIENIYNEYPAKKFDLDIDAKEVKAIWAKISSSDTTSHHYAIGNDGDYYGLKGLHIITKDIPNWFWSTFEHVDNLENSSEYQNNRELLATRDSYGYDSNGKISEDLENDFNNNNMSNKWRYYRLRGTQVDFTDPMGKPIVLANSLIEDGFMVTSSCITCHARATVGAAPKDFIPTDFRTYNRLDIFKNDSIPNSPGVIGPMDPSLFYNEYQSFLNDTLILTGKPKFIQTDFMWSFFRAKRKS